MEQRTIEDNRMHVKCNQLYYKPHRGYDDGLMESEDVEGRYILKVGVHETMLQNEAWLDVWYGDSEVTQHVHSKSCETFYVIEGDAQLITTGGINCTLHAGDIFHCPAGMGHEFHTIGEHMAWYNLFSNLHYWNIIQTEIDMSRFNPDKMKDVRYYRSFISSMNSRKLGPYPPILEDGTPYQVRRKGDNLISYEAFGITLNLKVAPWETNEVNEIWELVIKAGTAITLADPYDFWQTYIVTEGSVRCQVGEDSFTAIKDDFIQVYPHKPFVMEFTEDAKLLSWGSAYKLIHPLEEMRYIKREEPDKFMDGDFRREFMLRHNLPLFIVT